MLLQFAVQSTYVLPTWDFLSCQAIELACQGVETGHRDRFPLSLIARPAVAAKPLKSVRLAAAIQRSSPWWVHLITIRFRLLH